MLKRVVCVILVCLMLSGSVAASPYAIKVNRAANTVTIYEQDETGAYTKPVKAMVCSTARSPHTTPLGSFTLKEYRSEWRLMLDGTYGQYATCFRGHYLFHSVCYSDDRHDAMIRDAYNNLGKAASMGCVRLQTADAKWIFDNCPAGTPVTIYDDADNPGPLGKPDKMVEQITEQMHNGWDPTDPASGNPWKMIKAQKVTVKDAGMTLISGQSAAVEWTVEPAQAQVFWHSSDENVATVSNGVITAVGSGTAKITAEGYGGAADTITVTVKGELLPFADLTPGAWYYDAVRGAVEEGLFGGVSDNRFDPNVPMTRAMVVQVLYNMQKKPSKAERLQFADVPEDAWYYDAVSWAVSEGIVNGVSQTTFAPDRAMTRQELAAVLWRYAGEPEGKGDLAKFTDGEKTAPYAQTAMVWMTQKGLLQGTDGKLLPTQTATRLQTAVIMYRYIQ